MKNINRIFLIALPMLICTNCLLAQVDVKKVGQTSMKFLSVSVGARGAAMGDAFIAVVENAEAVFWNPAGITKVDKRYNFSVGYNKWISDITHNYGSFLYNGGNLGVFGVNMIWVDYGQIDGTRRSEVDPRGYVDTGSLSPSAFAIGLAYGRAISDQFSFGVNLKYVRQNLGAGFISTDASTESFETVDNALGLFAIDFGTLYFTGFHDLRLALSVSNISQEKSFIRESSPLPLIFKFGIAMDLIKLFKTGSSNQLTFEIDALHPRDFTERVHFGLEYLFIDFIALRAGYKTNYDEDDLSFGVGLQPSLSGIDFKIDYAVNTFGRFDYVHRISFGFFF
jgi:hypothetical protein